MVTSPPTSHSPWFCPWLGYRLSRPRWLATTYGRAAFPTSYRVAKINASPQLIEQLGELKHFGGLKDTNSQPTRYLEFLKRLRARFAVIPAGEPAAIFNLLSGAPGFMTVAANFLPELLVGIFETAQKRDLDRAFSPFDKLATYRSLFEARVAAGYPGYIVFSKADMNLRGLPAGHVLPPLTYPSAAELDRLREIMRMVLDLPVVA